MFRSQNSTFELKGMQRQKNLKNLKLSVLSYQDDGRFEIILLLSNRIPAEIVLIYIFYT